MRSGRFWAGRAALSPANRMTMAHAPDRLAAGTLAGGRDVMEQSTGWAGEEFPIIAAAAA